MAKADSALNFKSKKFDQAHIQQFISGTIERLDMLNRIYAKLGLGADYFKEQPHLILSGFDYGDILEWTPKIKHFKKENKFMSDILHITYFLFGARQLYIYNYAFNTDMSMHEELLCEVFYRDINAVSVESRINLCVDANKTEYKVPNSYFSVSFGSEKLSVPTMPDFDINNEQLFAARKFIRDRKFLG